MSSLPAAKDAKLDDHPNALSAYNVCLGLEKTATASADLMHARILGYLILHAPGPASNARAEIVNAIHSCNQKKEKLLELGWCFREWFIRPFKKFKGRTPASSDHPSRRSFDRVRDKLKASIQEAPKDHKQAKMQALLRDGYRCVVTGKYDVMAERDSLVDVNTIVNAGGAVHTELAHIVPQATFFDVSDKSPQKKAFSASVLAALQGFGYDVEKVNGPKVHSLYNVMTMQKDVHDWFDRLEIWFDSTGFANRYFVRKVYETYQLPGEVTFTSLDPLKFPYPSEALLALHAACAKVAHLSGAGEYIDEFDRDADELGVLATDGSSSGILTHVLLELMSRPVDTVV